MRVRIRSRSGAFELIWNNMWSFPRKGELVHDLHGEHGDRWRVADVQWLGNEHGLIEVCVWVTPESAL